MMEQAAYQCTTPMGSHGSDATDVGVKGVFSGLNREYGSDISITDTKQAISDEESDGDSCWIARLCSTDFFQPCSLHESLRKNECNYFCSSCPFKRDALCRHCVQEHTCSNSKAKFFQIRRYMYRYVVHLDDLSKYFDSSGIQSYCINQKKAVLLNPKDPSPNMSGTPVFENKCATCKVPLRPDCQYCCLDCKATRHQGMIIPKTPQSMKKRKRQQEPRIVKRNFNISTSDEFFEVLTKRTLRVNTSARRKGCGRSPQRARKLPCPCRSAFE